ncbi:MAG: hypothetical protein ACE5I7_15810 [Candidatus Binatia bacterium]
MHRAQILLEEWQYEALKSVSEQKGRSVSDLVREILTRHLRASGRRAKDPLSRIEGAANDAAAYGRTHDEVLYSKK